MQSNTLVHTALCTVAIYALRDPRDGEIRYVGKAENPDHRYLQHLQPSSLRATTKKNSWLKNLLAEDLTPELEIIDWVEPERADAAEIHWIAWHRMGGCRLTNGTDGGDGFRGNHTEETRARMSAVAAGRPKSREHAEAISRARRGIKLSEEARRSMSERMKGKVPEGLARAVAEGRLPNGMAHHNARLSEDDVREIRRSSAAGASRAEVGRRFGVSRQTVQSIVHRRTWRHVAD